MSEQMSASLQKKKQAIMAEVGQIQKDKKNRDQGFEYLSDDAVAAAVQAAMVKHGVTMSPPCVLDVAWTDKETKNGGKLIVCHAKVEMGLVDVETGEAEHGVVYGTGMDSGDKAIYKAMTGARKYFYRLIFGIGTGDDPDEHSVQAQPTQRQQAQQAPKQSAPPAHTDADKAAILAALSVMGTPDNQVKGVARFLVDSHFGGDIVAARLMIESWAADGRKFSITDAGEARFT